MNKWLESTFVLILLFCICFCGLQPISAVTINGMEPVRTLENLYAEHFQVDYYEDGSKLFSLSDGQKFLLIPENADSPSYPDPDIVLLHAPLHNIYLAATAVMCLFDALDSLDAIRLSGTRADGWYIENARAAMENGRILFAGKYSEPDYELLLENECTLAIESQMIGHASEVKDKLEELGIPVLVDLSSSERHPLARTEWIRFYGALLNREEVSDDLFAKQVEYMEDAAVSGSTGKSAAFFHISSSGLVVVRKSGDYVSKMIELAGGRYVFDNIGDPEKSTSTVTIDMETFFAAAREADVIIYNSTIAGELGSIQELLAKNELLGTFRAIQTGNVWCTQQNLYQDTTGLGLMIRSLHQILSGEADSLDEVPYFYRLK